MKTIFLDRDGVINKEIKYLHTIKDFHFIKGVFSSCKYLQNKGYKLIIVTNQSGIGRKYYSEEDFKTVSKWMINEFNKQNIKILDIFYCPHKPEDQCLCRKPKIGMLNTAHKKYQINKDESWLIGDKETDIKAANLFGIKNTILVESGHKIDKKNSKATYILPSIQEIGKYIK